MVSFPTACTLVLFSMLLCCFSAQTIVLDPRNVTEEENPAGQTTRAPVLNGIFIICERKGNKPTAKLFTSNSPLSLWYTTGQCKPNFVSGTTLGNTELDHHRLWPIFGEEFDELTRYYEIQIPCFGGSVSVRRGTNVLFTVRFQLFNTCAFLLSQIFN